MEDEEKEINVAVNNSSNFSLWFWIAGWMFTSGIGAIHPIPTLTQWYEQLLFALIALAGWPYILGHHLSKFLIIKN